MSEDFYLQAGAQRLAQIEAERAAALADLAAHKANHDQDSAAASIQQIANLDVELANLNNLYQRYQASQNPPAPPPLTDEERMARPWDKMTPDDGLHLARKSKYSRDLDWNDPNVRAGWAETQRRRHPGRADRW